MGKRAFVTGITGQDGSYLTELLLSKGYEVHGVIRRSSSFNTGRIDHLFHDIHESGAPLVLHYGDVTDASRLARLFTEVRPHEVYHLAAQSHVAVSFKQPDYTAESVVMGTLRILDAFRDYSNNFDDEVRYYQAGSSEMFGAAPSPQSENTPFYPRSPYAVSKVAAHWFAVNYRESYDLHISNGILFNHESERRGETFVTRKITRAIGRIKEGLQDKLYLGNLDAKRDWGHAEDYVKAMWLMLQQEEPDDYVVATGHTWSVQDFVDASFEYAGLDPSEHVKQDARYFRPAEVEHLLGDPTKAREKLGWEPSVDFQALVKRMVDADWALARQEAVLAEASH